MKIYNRRARFDYQITDKIEAGIALTGGETKAIRTGHLNLTGSFAKIIDNQVYLVGANVPIEGLTAQSGKKDYTPTRSRKLLLHRAEIAALESKIKAKRLTLVPIVVYTKGRRIKLELGLGKSKRKFEKRESIKKRDLERELRG
jgi:SsrA-binding protein